MEERPHFPICYSERRYGQNSSGGGHFRVFTHTARGADREPVATGTLDLAKLVTARKTSESLRLTSSILDSPLKFKVEMKGGESFAEAVPDVKAETSVARPVLKASWFAFKHKPDQIEADANVLAQAGLVRKPH
jgi:hypothetical protein